MSRAEHERDLYRALLQLHAAPDVEVLLQRILELVLDATGARTAYLAVGPGMETRSARWWTAHALDPDGVESVRAHLSTTLLHEATVSGVVHTTSARIDPRFEDRPSVQQHAIDAVLCAALGPSTAPVGVLYLGGQAPDGWFDDDSVHLVALLAEHVGPLASRLLGRLHGEEPDPTEPWRARLQLDGIIGRSPALARTFEQLAVAATALVPVLLTGATGTGKTSLARALHASSPNAARPFVAVNCAVLRPERALADLFGARAGAWTDLRRDRAGLVEEASGGTLFLDEVTELPLEVQAQLLSFLQDLSYRRLGEPRDRQAPPMRVISATNLDPDAAVADQRFRADLLYRLAALRVPVPGLAERGDDVVLLAHALVDRVARRHHIRSRPLSGAAEVWLQAQPWPGHVRQLEHTIQRGLLWAHTEGASHVRLGHLEQDATPPAGDAGSEDLRQAVAAFRRAHVQRVVQACGGNKSEAARRLGVHRSHVHQLLRDAGVDS